MVSTFDKLSSLVRKDTEQTGSNNIIQKNKCSTGIKGFDAISGGGFKQNSINLIAGPPGSGKSIFCTQFLMEGILKKNEGGVYLSFEENRDSFFDAMLQCGWDLVEYERQGKFSFVEYTPEQVEKILSEGGGLLDNLMEKVDAQRIVIDPISVFLLLDSNELVKRKAAFSLFKLIQKWKVTALLTHGVYLSEDQISAIDFQVDSITLLYHHQESFNQERLRYLEIFKMKGVNHLRKPVPFTISSTGFDLYPEGQYDDKGKLRKS